jgi:hypothetical protein
MKPTAKTTSESTKMDLLPDEVMLKAKQPSMSEEDRKVISHVVQRFDRMRSARVALDRLWQTYMLQYEAQFIPYADGRSRSNVPLERAVIELFVSKSISRRSKEELRGIGDTDQGKVEIMRRVKDHVDRLSNVEDELLMSDYTSAEFGTCASLTAYSEDARVIEDAPDGVCAVMEPERLQLSHDPPPGPTPSFRSAQSRCERPPFRNDTAVRGH